MGESRRRREYEQQRPQDRLGDAPVEAEYHAQMTAVVQVLDELFNGDAKGPDRGVGFLLMVFPFGEGGRTNFMSNGVDRKDVVTLMKEMIARFEGQPEVEGRA
jgi:hypothetical protein